MIKLPPAKMKGSIPLPYTIHVYTVEMSSDLNNAGYCWAETTIGVKKIKLTEEFTDDQLQFLALQSIVSLLANGAAAEIHTCSEWMSKHFYGRHQFRDPTSRKMLSSIREEILKRALQVEVMWFPFRENLARGLLRLPDRRTLRFKKRLLDLWPGDT